LFLLIIAGLEFGRMHMLRHTLNNAVYEGARRALVPKVQDSEVQSVVQQLLKAVAARNPRVTIQRANGAVTVSVELVAREQGWMVPWFFRNRTLRSSVTLQEEGQF
jgi:Flp pilus assembly protein TadG